MLLLMLMLLLLLLLLLPGKRRLLRPAVLSAGCRRRLRPARARGEARLLLPRVLLLL